MKPAVFDPDICNGLAPFDTRMRQGDIATHLLQCGDQSGTQWVHADSGKCDIAAGGQQGGYHRKGCRRGVPRHGNISGLQDGLALQGHMMGAVGGGGLCHAGTKMAQHGFRMVARGVRFGDGACATGIDTGQQDG